tara:strand:- start:1377 stop:2207 length:831 start_codon:yes stop_codon:yes gene_type:complete
MDLLEKMKSVGVYHFSPSQLNRPLANWMFEYVYLSKEKRREIVVGENAAFGTAVHTVIQAVVCHGQDIDEATEEAMTGYDFHPANFSDDKRDKFRELIPAASSVGIDLLSPLFAGAQEERKIELMLDGVLVPVMGYVDLFKDGLLAEIKTKAPRKGMIKKDGTRSWAKASLPKEPQWEHVMQAAVYWKATGATPNIAYVSAEDGVIFSPDNCDKMSQDALNFAIEEIRRKAITRQNLLAVSTDPKVLAGLMEPDFNHPFYWGHQFVNDAKELWSNV